ncbi:hypothetical protein L596_019100 [Steinernema carpocapsae]|uniref:Uncharacterized protein n=1 Tax=Steinernema carpocapsae TaxID=34508 RepID=A0A4U5N7U5_STECR|nr:hypothetical protein L596_019100 [Steinernema carpocapsae]
MEARIRTINLAAYINDFFVRALSAVVRCCRQGLKSYGSRQAEQPSNQPPKNNKRKAFKSKEKSIKTVAENVEGFVGDKDLNDILTFLGVDSANSKSKNKQKKKKASNASAKSKNVDSEQNSPASKSANDKFEKKNGKSKGAKKEKSIVAVMAAESNSAQVAEESQQASPTSEIDQEVDITLDTAEEEEFVSAPEDNVEIVEIAPINTSSSAQNRILLKLPGGREMSLQGGSMASSRSSMEEELDPVTREKAADIEAMWAKFNNTGERPVVYKPGM